MLKTLSGVLAIGFTTGAFCMAFTTMWQLSYLFSEWRLLFASLASILGMLIWITISHSLWEFPNKKSGFKMLTSGILIIGLQMLLDFKLVLYQIVKKPSPPLGFI
ncbi:hypothetical protein ACUXQE_002464 [Staphylococcus saprophyticus]